MQLNTRSSIGVDSRQCCNTLPSVAWKDLSRIMAGELPSLEKIGKGSFSWSGVKAIHMPDAVEGLLWHAIFGV